MRINKKSLKLNIAKAAQVAKATEREICGVLIDNGVCVDLVELRNQSKQKGCFYIGPRDENRIHRAAAQLGYRVVGTFHSHPYWLAIPGADDIDGAEDGSLMLIIDCLARKANLWRIRSGRSFAMKIELA